MVVDSYIKGLLMTSAKPDEARPNSAAFSMPVGVDTSTEIHAGKKSEQT